MEENSLEYLIYARCKNNISKFFDNDLEMEPLINGNDTKKMSQFQRGLLFGLNNLNLIFNQNNKKEED